MKTLYKLLLMRTTVAGVKRSSASVCASVCLSVCPHDNSKTNDHKVFKLGIVNDLGISYKWYNFGVKRSKVKVTGSQSAKRRSSGRREIGFIFWSYFDRFWASTSLSNYYNFSSCMTVFQREICRCWCNTAVQMLLCWTRLLLVACRAWVSIAVIITLTWSRLYLKTYVRCESTERWIERHHRRRRIRRSIDHYM